MGRIVYIDLRLAMLGHDLARRLAPVAVDLPGDVHPAELMGGILALDPSTAMFGWAHAEPGGAFPNWGSERIAKKGSSVEEVQDALDIFLKARVAVFHPEWIVHEQTFDGPNAQTNKLLHGISWHIKLCAKDWGLGCREAETMAFTKFFLGQAKFPGKNWEARRKAKKLATIARCRMLGWHVDDDNQADACGILCYAEVKLFPEMRLKAFRPAGPLFTGVSQR